MNFSDLVISIQRSIFNGVIGNCKTESSRKLLPINERVAADLWLWKEAARFTNPEDWIFASPRKGGTAACAGWSVSWPSLDKGR